MERIYLDHNATSVMSKQVKDFMADFFQNSHPYNPSSIHEDGRKSRGILEKARKQIAESLHINLLKNDIKITFMSSGTEVNNMVINNFQKHNLFIGATEHVSILDCPHPARILVKVDSNGLVCEKHLEKLLSSYDSKKIVSIMLANNETGVINNIKSLVEISHTNGALFHCDCSQAYGKIPLNFNELGADFITISSHKSGGPLGAAALVYKGHIELKPILKGGKQELGLRAGTENLPAIAGFGFSATLINKRVEKNKKIEMLRDFMEEQILKIAPKAIIIGTQAPRLPNTSSIKMPSVKSEEQLIKFDLAGFSVSAGSACSSGRISISHVLQAMEVDENTANETIRISLGPETTREEIERFINQWKKIYNKE